MAVQLDRTHVKVPTLAGSTTTAGAGMAAGEIALRGLILVVALAVIVADDDSGVGLLAAAILALGSTVIGWRS